MSVAATGDLEIRRALAGAHAAGRLAHAGLELSREAFDAHALVVAARRRARTDAQTAPALDVLVASAAASDLYLAAAAIHGVDGAWEQIENDQRMRLTALARARGAGTAEAERLATDVLGDLALPGGGQELLLATYDGTGSLFGWLATILVRRLWRAARATRRRARTLDAEGVALPSEPRLGPGATAATREWEARVRSALESVLERLTPRERCVLVMTHADGRSGRDIARILRVGPPRVSRLLQQATTKVREGLLPLVRSAGVRGRLDEASWDALRDCVGEALKTVAIPGPEGPLPGGGARHEEGPSDA